MTKDCPVVMQAHESLETVTHVGGPAINCSRSLEVSDVAGLKSFIKKKIRHRLDWGDLKRKRRNFEPFSVCSEYDHPCPLFGPPLVLIKVTDVLHLGHPSLYTTPGSVLGHIWFYIRLHLSLYHPLS